MATYLTHLTIIALCVLTPALLAPDFITAAQEQQEQQKQDAIKEPQVLLKLGPMKIGVAYKENKLKDRLKLYKTAINYYLGDGQGQFQRHFMKVAQRDELIRCQNFLAQTPEMESLIDCKPLEDQVIPDNQSSTRPSTTSGDVTTLYVKRTTLTAKAKLNFLPYFPSNEFRPELQLYPFKKDFTEQSIMRVLKQHNMEQGLGFGPSALTSGHFVELRSGVNNKQAHDSLPYHCTANLFISINQTRPVPAQTPGDDYPEVLHAHSHYIDEIRENGGFVSIQDASCNTPLVPVSINSDFTLIYRKQFPYLTCSHHVNTIPIPNLWNYTGTIQQTKGVDSSTSEEAYATKIDINSVSNSFKNLNFVLSQNFTNLNFSTGFEQMLLAHPYLTAFVRGDWTEDSVEKIFATYPIESLGAFKNKPDGPNLLFTFSDKPDVPRVTFSLSIDRKTFYNLLSWQNLSKQEEEPEEEELNMTSFAAVLNAIPPELRSQIEDVVQHVLRDEL